MNNINAIVAAWSAQVFRAGLHTLHRFKSVSLRASHGAPHSIFRYEIDLSKPKPIEIPAHLAELLPSEEALQELDNFFPGSSDVLLELAQEANEPAEDSIAQAETIVPPIQPKNYRATAMLLHLHEQRLLRGGLQDADASDKSS